MTENGEQGATVIWMRAPGSGSWRRCALGLGQGVVGPLDDLIAGAAVRLAEIHRAPRGDETHQLLRRLHLGLENPGRPGGKT